MASRVCLNCTAGLTTQNQSDFCSRSCTDDYWSMEYTEETHTRQYKQQISDEKAEKAMAKKTQTLVTLVDDLTGAEFAEGEGETVRFSLDGQRYTLDLNTKNAAAFRKALEKYVSVAQKVGAVSSTGAPSEAAQIRAWAAQNGKEVNERGRIPAALVEEYHAATATESA